MGGSTHLQPIPRSETDSAYQGLQSGQTYLLMKREEGREGREGRLLDDKEAI